MATIRSASTVDDHVPNLCDLSRCHQQQEGMVEMEMFNSVNLEPVVIRLHLCKPHQDVMMHWSGLVVRVRLSRG